MKTISSFYLFLITISCLLICNSCKKTDLKITGPGVSIELAKLRSRQIRNVKYDISFIIPDSVNENVTGLEKIEFYFSDQAGSPLILDFRNPEHYLKSVKIGNKKIKYEFSNEHIIISSKKLKTGKNQIEIEFTAGERALNRNPEYLYTLFVPDRACTAFPCFDQPSLKANFKLEVTAPEDWSVITNSPLVEQKQIENTGKFSFHETKPISTYLFSFVAGKFQSITKRFDDKEITLYHRQENKDKIKLNIDKIFDLHYGSLKWLEEYTQIKYPFSKFDFVIIPSFQYSGMEHPGAILYRDSRMFLEENATIREELNRANLIAHETAHMWFGDLVTMEWFSEVWLKEVFANFMAGKIVNPQYPNINHDLNFLISHYPSSYSIDRSKGANPIEQELDNMKNAGTLYGNIIYHKAPIVMNHLEQITGEQVLQEGLQEYLNKYSFGNATWSDLITILDKKIEQDLKSWSNTWVNEAGMPHYVVRKAYNTDQDLQSIIIEQTDPVKKGRMWNQNIEVLVRGKNHDYTFPVALNDTFNIIILEQTTNPLFIFPNSTGSGYGFFKIDSISIQNIVDQLPTIKNPILKCSMYISLWENMLNQCVSPIKLFECYRESLRNETDPQNLNLLLGYIETLFWKFLTEDQRTNMAKSMEDFFLEQIDLQSKASLKSAYFNTFRKVVTTQNGVDYLYQLWNKEIKEPGLKISENDYIELAYELVIRNYKNSDSILKIQHDRISDYEKKQKFKFISSTVSPKKEQRDKFFNKLMDEKNREKEPWVIEALHYLHHPLRKDESLEYIIPSLEILPELQKTGDIFFPKRWLDATFWGYSSIDAVMDINLFLNQNPDLPNNLKNKVLQSTDLLFRASIIKNEE